jgi:hypothetical protein
MVHPNNIRETMLLSKSSTASETINEHLPPPPQKIVHYPIHGDLTGGILILMGDKQAKHVVYLLGGFPDDHQVSIVL